MGGFLHGGSTSCPMFMLEIVHAAHIITVQPYEISTGDLLTCSEKPPCLCAMITYQAAYKEAYRM